MYGLLVAQAFWPVGSKSAGHEPSLAGAEAAVAGGIAMFVVLGSSLFWLLGAAIATLGSDREAPSFP